MIRFFYNLLWPLGLVFFLPGYLIKMFRRGNYREKFGQRLGIYDAHLRARLYWKNGKIPVPGFYDKIRKLTSKERATIRRLPADEAKFRSDMGVLDGVNFARESKTRACARTSIQVPAIVFVGSYGSTMLLPFCASPQ